LVSMKYFSSIAKYFLTKPHAVCSSVLRENPLDNFAPKQTCPLGKDGNDPSLRAANSGRMLACVCMLSAKAQPN
jgi:hypothetical protein